MKSLDLAWLSAGFSGSVAVVACIVAVTVLQENRSMHSQLLQVRRESALATAEAERLREEQASSDQGLAEQRARLATLTEEVAALRDAAAQSSPRMARIRVFAGNQYVGGGWYVPPKGGLTNGTVVDPLVFLDLPAQRVSAAGRPADSAQSVVPTSTTINYNNYPADGYYPYGYYYWWPTGWVWTGTNCPPGTGMTPPTPPTPPTDPTAPTPPTSPGGVNVAAFEGPRRTRSDYWTPSARPTPITGPRVINRPNLAVPIARPVPVTPSVRFQTMTGAPLSNSPFNGR